MVHWGAGRLRFEALQTPLNQRTASHCVFSGPGQEKTYHAKLQLSLGACSGEGWKFRNGLKAQLSPAANSS